MKLPTLVIASFNRSCQAPINDIENFLARCNPDDLITGTESLGRRRLERLRLALWQQWCRKDTAWRNHQPANGNVGMETLDGLGMIVEATGMAVADMLPISGRALGTKHEAGSSDSTMSHHALTMPVARPHVRWGRQRPLWWQGLTEVGRRPLQMTPTRFAAGPLWFPEGLW